MVTVYLNFYKDISPDTRHLTEHALGLGLLEQGLSRDFGLSLDPSDIIRGPHGKPCLKSRPDIHFNISHCHGLAACALSDVPVGIDVENIRPFREHLLRKALTAEEQRFLDQKSTGDTARQEWFFRFWTLKESRIKHSGVGMSVPFTSFSFTFSDTPDMIQCSEPGLYFLQRLLRDRYLLSVCTSEKEPQLRVVECPELTCSELI